MKNMLQLSAVACKVFNIFTLTEQMMLRSSSSQSRTRNSRYGGTWRTRKANHGCRSHILWHSSNIRSREVKLRARRNSHLLDCSVTCSTRCELIKLCLGNLHPVHDGLVILFTKATEELEIEKHLLLVIWQRSNNIIDMKVGISLSAWFMTRTS